MASCLDVPLSSVQGWFGTGPFPQQITVVRSPTFGDPTVPTVQMFSSTALVAASDSTSAAQEAALGSPKFPACYGQYQVAALAVPATGQVQTVPLTAPSGTKAYGFLTMFTLADGATELVGEAFILGSGVTTLLEASTDGPSIPPEDFTRPSGPSRDGRRPSPSSGFRPLGAWTGGFARSSNRQGRWPSDHLRRTVWSVVCAGDRRFWWELRRST